MPVVSFDIGPALGTMGKGNCSWGILCWKGSTEDGVLSCTRCSASSGVWLKENEDRNTGRGSDSWESNDEEDEEGMEELRDGREPEEANESE